MSTTTLIEQTARLGGAAVADGPATNSKGKTNALKGSGVTQRPHNSGPQPCISRNRGHMRSTSPRLVQTDAAGRWPA
jgi:hypothetical protein